MVLRDADRLVVDSLNYGGIVDPWAGEGYQAASGLTTNGCYVTTPGAGGFGPLDSSHAFNTSAGRFPDGVDTASNCIDFVSSPATTLLAAAPAGATNIKIAGAEGFGPGQTIRIGAGGNLETAVIARVGTAGAATVDRATPAGATLLHLDNTFGFNDGQTVVIDSGADSETAVVAFVTRWDNTITVAAPLTHAHATGTELSGTGITLTTALTREHRREAPVTGNLSTPGAPNNYFRIAHQDTMTAP